MGLIHSQPPRKLRTKSKSGGVTRTLPDSTLPLSFSGKCKSNDVSVIFLAGKSQQTAKNGSGDSALVSSSGRCLPAGCSGRTYLLLEL
jgi:hypothetical protein